MKWIYFLGLTYFFCFSFITTSFNIPNILQQKLEKAISSTFEDEKLTISEVDFSQYEIQKKDELHIFRISKNENLIGYAYLSQANSKHDVYDFVVLYDKDLEIKKSKILIYRENYGRQVGSQRWLRQFIGMKPGETFKYGDDISAVSGATITATSMTKAVQKSLDDMKTFNQ
ncbi:FMN-binding protein [Psychroflexus tropicus]|uniref:FMN-binding protein n=1 Tax=Psychroflexus tropicus TaxID=197345 RepID=UPI000366012D|nr:FMN-binding protein [Psychroflexus tropicus]